MVERTDELEADLEDGEAQSAIDEAQSVLDDVETSTGTGDSGSLLGGSSGADASAESESGSGGLSMPSLPSMPSPSMPDFDELFSTGWFVLALVGCIGSLIAGGMVLSLLGQFGGYAALFGLAFVLGLASSDGNYLEVGLAAALTSGVLGFLQRINVAIASGSALKMTAVAAGLGLVAALVGHYFGRDLRAGLGRDTDGGDSGGIDDYGGDF